MISPQSCCPKWSLILHMFYFENGNLRVPSTECPPVKCATADRSRATGNVLNSLSKSPETATILMFGCINIWLSYKELNKIPCHGQQLCGEIMIFSQQPHKLLIKQQHERKNCRGREASVNYHFISPEAIEQMQHALQLSPTNQDAREMLDILLRSPQAPPPAK